MTPLVTGARAKKSESFEKYQKSLEAQKKIQEQAEEKKVQFTRLENIKTKYNELMEEQEKLRQEKRAISDKMRDAEKKLVDHTKTMENAETIVGRFKEIVNNELKANPNFSGGQAEQKIRAEQPELWAEYDKSIKLLKSPIATNQRKELQKAIDEVEVEKLKLDKEGEQVRGRIDAAQLAMEELEGQARKVGMGEAERMRNRGAITKEEMTQRLASGEYVLTKRGEFLKMQDFVERGGTKEDLHLDAYKKLGFNVEGEGAAAAEAEKTKGGKATEEENKSKLVFGASPAPVPGSAGGEGIFNLILVLIAVGVVLAVVMGAFR